MIAYIFLRIFLSLSIILVIHYLYDYFKQSLTNPIERNVINETNKKYEEMYSILKNNKKVEETTTTTTTNGAMETELDDFISNLEN